MNRFLTAAAALLLARLVVSQTTFATITGLVTDPNGAAVPNATITVTNTETNYRYSARSNETGNYTVGQLLEGSYTLRAEAPGFAPYEERDFRLVNQQIRRIDVQLALGAVQTTVEVRGSATLIETETARISDTKSADVIKTLPLNSRTLWNFVGQNPSVIQAANGAATRRFSGKPQQPVRRLGRRHHHQQRPRRHPDHAPGELRRERGGSARGHGQ